MQMDYLAPIKALADETRLRLFSVLARHELNVNELTSLFSMGQSRISRHLRILSDAGLVSSRRQGQWIFYRRKTEDRKVNEMSGGVISLVEGWPELEDDLSRASAIVAARISESKRFFASVNERNWEEMKSDLDGGVDLDGRIVDWLEERGTVADIGCGTGDLLVRLRTVCRHVIGVDHVPQMLERARSRLAENSSSVDLRIGDVSHLPLGDGEADAMVMNMVLHHLPQPEAVFAELARVTRHGGQLIVAELETHALESVTRRFGDVWQGFSGSDLMDWLDRGGWRTVRHEVIPIGLGIRAHLVSAKKKI